MLAIGVMIGWFIAVLMVSDKIRELNDEIDNLKASAKVSNGKRVKK
jgi:hypothetical protein